MKNALGSSGGLNFFEALATRLLSTGSMDIKQFRFRYIVTDKLQQVITF